MTDSKEFNKRGFVHLKQVIPDDVIAALQKECNQLLIGSAHKYGHGNSAFTNSTGCIIEATHDIPNGLYLASSYCECRKRLKLNEIVSKYIVGKHIKNMLRKLTNSEHIFLLNEQYVVKPSNSNNTQFVWHQDSEYLSQPYLNISVWIPMDDISQQNGSIFMLPFENSLNINSWRKASLLLKKEEIDRLQNMEKNININDEPDEKKIFESEKQENIFDKKKMELFPKAGDMIIFTSLTFHKSNCNLSDRMRRVLLLQYSTFPIIDRMNKKLARLVVKL